MKLAEAYTTLGLAQGASLDDAKKQYKLLAKKWHPDLNKAPEAEETFKKINEAYQIVSTGKPTDREDAVSRARATYGGNPFGRQQFYDATPVDTYTTISFLESVWGVKKDIKYSRQGKCTACNGQGESTLNNGCTECGGRGQTVSKKGNMVYVSTCTKCFGQSNTEDCKSCNATGTVDSEVSVHVTIPGGVSNGSILRLSGMGNFAGVFMMSLDQYTDAMLHIHVTPDPGLSLDGQHVISKLEVSLLEAIRGCNKSVKTVLGHQHVEIKPMSRNGDTIVIPRMGVNRTGDQRVILDVKYPQDINKLVTALTEEGIS